MQSYGVLQAKTEAVEQQMGKVKKNKYDRANPLCKALVFSGGKLSGSLAERGKKNF